VTSCGTRNGEGWLGEFGASSGNGGVHECCWRRSILWDELAVGWTVSHRHTGQRSGRVYQQTELVLHSVLHGYIASGALSELVWLVPLLASKNESCSCILHSLDLWVGTAARTLLQ